MELHYDSDRVIIYNLLLSRNSPRGSASWCMETVKHKKNTPVAAYRGSRFVLFCSSVKRFSISTNQAFTTVIALVGSYPKEFPVPLLDKKISMSVSPNIDILYSPQTIAENGVLPLA